MMMHKTAVAKWKCATVIGLAVALSTMCGSPPCAADEGALPVTVRSALSASSEDLRAVQLVWEKQPAKYASVDALVKRIGEDPASAAVLPFRIKRFAWQDGKFYERSVALSSIPNEPIGGKTRPLETEVCFDGRLHYTGTPRDEGSKGPEPVLTVNSRDVWAKRVEDRTIFYSSEYFECAGYDLNRTAATVDQPPRSLILHRLASGGRVTAVREELLDNVACVTVQIATEKGSTRYTLDPTLGHAVRRSEELDRSGKQMRVTTNSDFVALPGTKTWLPRQSVTDWSTWYSTPDVIDGKPFIRTTIIARDIDNKRLPDAAFRLEYTKPGTRVHSSEVPGADKTADGMVYYRVPTNPDHLDEVIRQAAEEQNAGKKAPWYRYVLGGVTIALGVALGVLLYVRWRRLKKSADESRPESAA